MAKSNSLSGGLSNTKSNKHANDEIKPLIPWSTIAYSLIDSSYDSNLSDDDIKFVNAFIISRLNVGVTSLLCKDNKLTGSMSSETVEHQKNNVFVGLKSRGNKINEKALLKYLNKRDGLPPLDTEFNAAVDIVYKDLSEWPNEIEVTITKLLLQYYHWKDVKFDSSGPTFTLDIDMLDFSNWETCNIFYFPIYGYFLKDIIYPSKKQVSEKEYNSEFNYIVSYLCIVDSILNNTLSSECVYNYFLRLIINTSCETPVLKLHKYITKADLDYKANEFFSDEPIKVKFVFDMDLYFYSLKALMHVVSTFEMLTE